MQAKPNGPADLIVHHAKIITVDAKFSIAEAIAVKDGRILALGDDERIFKLSGPKTRVGPGHRASGGPRDLAHVVK